MASIARSSVRLRRSFFYVPGSSMKMIQKATSLGADCVVLDCEDGVAFSQKDEARSNISTALQTLDFGPSERLVRINPLSSGNDLYQKDVESILKSDVAPDGLVLPKVESISDLDHLANFLTHLKRPSPIVGMIESPKGLLNLPDIAQHPSLQALVFGADDYAAAAGATRSKSGEEVLFARSMMHLYASANNLQAIDMVRIDLSDEEGFFEESKKGFELGFAGKQLIHPKQIHPVHVAFSPSSEKIAWAQRVMDAYEVNQQTGKGAFLVDGAMIDMPSILQAQQILLSAPKL